VHGPAATAEEIARGLVIPKVNAAARPANVGAGDRDGLELDGDVRNAGYIATSIELLKTDKRAFFTACSKASKAAEYLGGLALSEPAAMA
jgi:antirestriction protein ArdC